MVEPRAFANPLHLDETVVHRLREPHLGADVGEIKRFANADHRDRARAQCVRVFEPISV